MPDKSDKRESNKINLQLGMTSLERMYYVLKAIADVGVVKADDAANKLIPKARSEVGTWSKATKDWHTALSFHYMGLIAYANDNEFAVSAKGQALLDAFELKLEDHGSKKKPILKDKLTADGRRDLLYKILVETRIRQDEYGRDIHPYLLLFKFLGEERLSHYVANYEWERFLESPESLRDDQYEQFVSNILVARNEKRHLPFKRLDRILTMLVNWGVLKKSGSGNETRFSFAKEYVNCAAQMKTEQLPAVDEAGVEAMFVNWLMAQPSNKGGGLITEMAAKNYAAKLRLFLSKPLFKDVGCKNAYAEVELRRFVSLRKKVESVPDFKKFDKAKANGNGYFSKALKYYERFLSLHPELLSKKALWLFDKSVRNAGLFYDYRVERRFVAALLAKPFVILTGLSGSGKTKLAEAFTRWLCGNNPNRCKLVAVGADWTNSEKLLGYPNALKLSEKKYVMPDTGVLKLLIEASKKENEKKPFFLILDEMNLSHVERYFADFLSTMESVDGEIHLYDGADIDDEATWFSAEDGTKIPPRIKFPRNLFVIGTMNVDETTYMFSPKVLDRAQVVEFCVDQTDLARYFACEKKRLDFEQFVDGRGAEYAEDFLLKAYETHPFSSDAQAALTLLFPKLKKLGAEFGFRTAGEFSDFVTIYESLGGDSESAVDAAIAQKILPKLHGSQGVFSEVIDELLMFARPPKENALEEQAKEDAARAEGMPAPMSGKYDVRYPLTAEKLERMQVRLRDNGFASFAEA